MPRHNPKADDLEQIITAKCPKCQKTHETKLYWTGKGTPRIYCKECTWGVRSASNVKKGKFLFPGGLTIE